MNDVAVVIRRPVLPGWLWLGALALGAMIGPRLAAACPIDGPSTVGVNESFTLCGSPGSGYTYEWHGPGLTTSSQRCVTVSGRSSGTFEYTLIVRSDGVERERCRQVVRVGSGALGTLTCSISGPTSIEAGSTAQWCAPQSARHSYQWTGPGGFTASGRCITVSQPGAYDLSIVNDLTGYARTCSQTLEVAGYGVSCAIEGPAAITRGSTVQLCGRTTGNVAYQWEGPSGLLSSNRCVTVRTAGTYVLTVRNRSTGDEDQCSHRLDWTGGSAGACVITGPTSVAAGGTATLCATSYANATYSWTGPGGFRSSQRCVTVKAGGLYQVTVRDRSTALLRECDFTLQTDDGEPDDADVEVSDNCPRSLAFWQQQCRRSADGRRVTPTELTLEELRSIARCVDGRSTYFNWSDDLAGFCAALNPVRPLTNRKLAARNHAALLANVCAGELGITTENGDPIALDPDTPGSFGSASTIGELIALSERMLAGRAGSFSRLNQYINAVNRGRGIGPVCP